MVREHKRKMGSRNYKTGYTEEDLSTAVNAVKNGGMSIRQSSRRYNIPFGTLSNKIKNLHTRTVGHLFQIAPDTQKLLVEVITCLTIWKIPLTASDICLLVKGYLDSRGVVDRVFNDNLPGRDWLNSFMRQYNLTQRLAENVTSSRAEVSCDTINAYFDNLEGSVHGIHPNDMYNYDETNITDNPGSKKVIVPRGMRRVKRKAEHSKQSVSVMFCGNASGQFLPPMVVYKAQNLYTEWTLGGPTNAVYDVSKSGWFDSRTFEMWFLKVFLANVNVSSRTTSTNPIFLIGDDLPSHFSVSVINECLKYNIVFVTMPAKFTHLCQPLDVAVFGPAKRAWRQILDGWRKESRSKGCIPKSQFPALLKRLFNALPPSNLVSGFRACGIYGIPWIVPKS